MCISVALYILGNGLDKHRIYMSVSFWMNTYCKKSCAQLDTVNQMLTGIFKGNKKCIYTKILVYIYLEHKYFFLSSYFLLRHLKY